MKRTAIKVTSLLTVILMTLSFVSCVREATPPAGSEGIVFPEIESVESVHGSGTETDKRVSDTVDAETVTETETEAETVVPITETETENVIDWTPVTQTVEYTIIGDDTEDGADNNAPPYEPSYSSGAGRAPLALMYHLVLDQPYSALENLFVRPSELRQHIEALLEKGYTFIFADDYASYDTKTVIMSFDDGYIDNYTEMFPIIKEYNVKVTVFMITNYVGCPEYLTADMIKEMSDSGLVSFQSHTATHPNLTGLSQEQLRWEFETSNKALEDLTGRPVKALCYPTGAYSNLVLSVAKDYYSFAYTTVSTSSTAGYPLLELPRLRVNRGFSKDYFYSIIP